MAASAAGGCRDGSKNSWQINRASARSMTITYFRDLYACWCSYERAMLEFLGLGDRNRRARRARVERMKRWVNARFATNYLEPETLDGCVSLERLPPTIRARYGKLQKRMSENDGREWSALTLPTTMSAYRNVYAQLGEMMLIANERIAESIVEARAENYAPASTFERALPRSESDRSAIAKIECVVRDDLP